MNSSQAQELSHLWCHISGLLDQSVAFVQDNDEEKNYLEYRMVVGKLMGDLFCDAMQPLYKRFPELLPDYLGGPHKIPESVSLPTFYDLTQRADTETHNATQPKMSNNSLLPTGNSPTTTTPELPCRPAAE